jgi:hypothetical protein
VWDAPLAAAVTIFSASDDIFIFASLSLFDER